MKKNALSLVALVLAIVATLSVSGGNNIRSSETENAAGMRWYNFNGSDLSEMCDPSMYSPDEDNWPDCPPTVGSIYCEIHARPSQWEDGEPDLMTINAHRYRQVE